MHQDLADSGGVEYEENNAYLGHSDKKCHMKKDSKMARVSSHITINEGDEDGLQRAVAKTGPVSVAIDASLDTFRFYSTGVYEDEKCAGDSPNHAVLAVGYGEEDGTAYWTLKNSWGSDWGKEGYIHMKRGENMCGIANRAVYPKLSGCDPIYDYDMG